MAKLTTKSLSDLYKQAAYSPEKQRLIQINACETLLHLIQQNKSYPYSFICYHLTGYKPKFKKNEEKIPYETLLRDLPAYAEGLSRTCELSSKDFNQKVYTANALAKRYRVNAKTIARWRDKGLFGRYMSFPDGRKRLGFLASSIEYFVQLNRKKIRQSSQFRKISATERELIEKRLQKWSQRCPNQRQIAIIRTARKFNRCLETIRSIIQQVDAKDSATPLFSTRASHLSSEKQLAIYKAYKSGTPVQLLMKEYQRSKSSIYSIINTQRYAHLLNSPIEYMHHADFDKPSNHKKFIVPTDGILDNLVIDHKPLEDCLAISHNPSLKPLDVLDTYVQDIGQHEILSAKQETFLFAKYNYLKYLAKQLQSSISPSNPDGKQLRHLRLAMAEINDLKSFLIRSNLRLVVSTARKHEKHYDMLELISEGNIAIMNAVEKFDFSREVKFSTYATWAIIRRYATLKTQALKAPAFLVSEEMIEVEQNLRIKDSNVLEVESARRSLDSIMDETLEEREKVVVYEHYGLASFLSGPGQRKAKSFNQIGKILGLSKERVRQIELKALDKLRKVLSGDEFNTLIPQN